MNRFAPIPPSDAPVVVLDSGLGGLTVVQAIHAALPHERIVYFGDTARLPYGSKTPATVTLFVKQIIHYLLPMRPKHVVIACNTASALALEAVRREFPKLLITGVVEPGARAAVAALAAGRPPVMTSARGLSGDRYSERSAPHKCPLSTSPDGGGARPPVVGVIATEATVRSRAYVSAIQRYRPDAKVITRATPLLVPIIEEGRLLDDPLVELCLKQYLAAILDQGPSALVLGCTHYPILRPLICRMVGEQVRVIDSAAQCAQDVREHLEERGLLRDADLGVLEMIRPAGVPPIVSDGHPWLECYVTDDSPRFATLASRFLGWSVRPPELVSPDSLYANAMAITVV